MKEGFLFEYVHGTGPLFSIDPALKLLLLAAVCIAAAVLPGMALYVLTALSALLYFTAAKKSAALKHIRGILLFIAITGAIRGYSAGAAADGILFACRMLCMLFSGSVFYSTTRLSRLAGSAAKMGGAGGTVSRITGMLVMTAAFLPVIFRYMEELRQARYSRCFSARIKDLKSLFRYIRMITVPLLNGMLVHTDSMADAWYSRCYGSRDNHRAKAPQD